MANYKRRSRRRDKRYMYPCGCCVDRRANNKLRRHEYIDDEPSNGKNRSKAKKRPKKQKLGPKCRHEWYIEEAEETRYNIECGKEGCEVRHYRYWGTPWCESKPHEPYDKYRKKVPYKVKWEQATCINCWEVRKYNVWDPDDWGNPAYRRDRGYYRPWKPRTAYRKP